MFYRQWNEFVAIVDFDIVSFPRAEVAIWNDQVAAGKIAPVHHLGTVHGCESPCISCYPPARI